MTTTPDTLPDDPAVLKAMLLAKTEEVSRMATSLRAYEAMVEALKLRIARLKRQKFGRSSEKIDREIAQLELALEGLEVARAVAEPAPAEDEEAAPSPETSTASETDQPSQKTAPRRRGKPKVAPDTPRERIVLDPGEHCPDCGGPLRLVGEDVAEILDFIAAKLKVVETARLKKSCRHCQTMVQPPAPTRPVERGMAGPGLLAHILVSKYDDHLPLYRQAEILARHGADIPRSTLIDWCGQGVATLRPLIERIKASVLAADRLHADDTPIRVLDPGRRKATGDEPGVKEGRIWAYVHDDRPWGGTDPPAVAYFFSPDRKGEHPQRHLANFRGILQADAYAGFRKLYEARDGTAPRVREAACWAHLRRDFHDVWKATDSPLARDALEQIGALYDIERRITGLPAEQRLAIRQAESRPRVEAFKTWCETQLPRIPGKSDLAKAMRYALGRWSAFTLFLENGEVAIDNNPAERAIKPVVLGRKNFLFAGSDSGGEVLADAMTLIETAKMSGLNPEAYLTDILARINDHKINRLDELLPWNWRATDARHTAAA
ncbi:IS66 family transposase [uncultured Rhodospira sp.]|uniref:IS66 family transposase n=1 Tax=uncultured Rhodospira sp. TaxID=1936189 RepID=UPI00260DBA07|nr:IS66 family transposase [uncultured Rhodospira sp.]